MRIGDGTPPAAAATHYQSPAEELHACVVEAFERSNLLARMALADALERGTDWSELPRSVRELFESVVKAMGLDP
jgi:hypothetical protein